MKIILGMLFVVDFMFGQIVKDSLNSIYENIILKNSKSATTER